MKKHMTKRALMSSALSLLLCVAMLIGTTFAWFTDSVTSANNIIKSGNLDVTMEWKDATATGKVTTYKDASTGPIFNYDLWEPGYVEAKNIRIRNVGSLALKYQLNIIANGEVSALAKVIDVYYAEEELELANRDLTSLKRVGTLSEVLAGMPGNASGDLLKGESDTVTIALKMQESAGNEYQDKSIGTNFSVQLLATQLTAEEDSFDDQYDKDAKYPWDGSTVDTSWYNDATEYVINTAEELAGFATLVNGGTSFEGKTITLGRDIDLNNKEWTPIGTGSNPFNGTFDGNNKTISNVKLGQNSKDSSSLVTGDDYGYAYGLFGVIGWQTGAHQDDKVTIKNLKLDVSFETTDAYVMGGLVGADAAGHKGSAKNSSLACDIEISNIIVNGKILSINNQSGATVGGVAGKLYTKGNIIINGCINNAEVKAETSLEKDNKVGGIVGFYSGANSATITNNTNNGNITSKSARPYGSKASGICITGSTTVGVDISNNTNNGNITGTENAVAAIAFSGNDQPIYKMTRYTTMNNSNSGKLYTLNSQTFDAEEVDYIFLVYGGKSQTPADNTTDDVKDAGNPVLEINGTTKA